MLEFKYGYAPNSLVYVNHRLRELPHKNCGLAVVQTFVHCWYCIG